MESSTILTADILDIIFEGRNKEYGAYDLRRTYGRRLTVSIAVMLSVILMLGMGYAFAGNKKQKTLVDIIPTDVTLEKIKEEKPAELPPPPPPPKQPEVKVEMKQFTPPRIVHDEDVTPPPEVETLEDAKIATYNQEGVKDENIIAPPGDDHGREVVEAPKKDEEDYERTFTKVEIESQYPGGPQAWQRYLNRSLRYPPVEDIQGTIVVQFIVDQEGNVSNVEAISGPEELRAEAVRVIKKSGKWTPAIQNGRQVKSYKKQPIVFRLETEG